MAEVVITSLVGDFTCSARLGMGIAGEPGDDDAEQRQPARAATHLRPGEASVEHDGHRPGGVTGRRKQEPMGVPWSGKYSRGQD